MLNNYINKKISQELFMKNLKIFRNFFQITQEELAKKLSLGKLTISQYEIGRNAPTFSILKKMVFFFELSFDYFLLENSCLYPRNLKLLKLSKILDDSAKAQARNHIEITAESLLKNKEHSLKIKQDNINLVLTENFHSNLKEIRKIKKISQLDLAKLLNFSRSSVSMYEFSQYPSIENLIKLSEILNISIHALTTGEKLSFNFQDKHFEKKMLLADQLLPFEDHKFLIKLMENIIK